MTMSKAEVNTSSALSWAPFRNFNSIYLATPLVEVVSSVIADVAVAANGCCCCWCCCSIVGSAVAASAPVATAAVGAESAPVDAVGGADVIVAAAVSNATVFVDVPAPVSADGTDAVFLLLFVVTPFVYK